LIKGPSIARVIQNAVSDLPAHIHVVGPRDKTNTYDLIGLASVGLAYTTTTGLEMAMRGVPVVVAGQTHYRGRGFTWDASSWDEYNSWLAKVVDGTAPNRLSQDEVASAWRYAYRFFFDYPLDFPWRLMHFWQDLDKWPVARVLGPLGQDAFGQAFHCLTGERRSWN
jgi:hypothetical protein